MFADMARGKTTLGVTLSHRALITRGTPPSEPIDIAVKAESTGAIDAIWVGNRFRSKLRPVFLLSGKVHEEATNASEVL
jgi:hypothetical protein